MRRVILLIMGFVVLSAPVPFAFADETADEVKKLEGTWEGYAVEGTGERADRGPVHVRLKFSGTKIDAVDLGNDGKDMGTGTFKLDPSKKLKEIDATGVVLPGKRERSFQGIYEVVDNDSSAGASTTARRNAPRNSAPKVASSCSS